MKERLLIIGASGHGKVVADIALKMNKWKEIAFLDNNEAIKTSMGLDVKGKLDDVLLYLDQYDFFVGIGNNEIRKEIQNTLEKLGATIPNLIHPNSIIGEHVDIGVGTSVMAGAIINCCTTIGKGCILNTGATIDHDNRIEDFVHISPGAHLAGNVKVGHGSWLGIGCVVSNNVTIKGGCKIGAGAVVVKDTNETGIFVGVPAKKIN